MYLILLHHIFKSEVAVGFLDTPDLTAPRVFSSGTVSFVGPTLIIHEGSRSFTGLWGKVVHCRYTQEWNARTLPTSQGSGMGKTGKCL